MHKQIIWKNGYFKSYSIQLKENNLNQLKVMKKWAVLLLLVWGTIVNAETQPYQIHELFFGSNLIVHVKITNHTDNNYTIRIQEIFRDYEIGIEKGEFIKLKKDFHVITSTEKVSSKTIADRKSGLAFLMKTESGWHMREFYVDQSENNLIRMHINGCEIKGTKSNIKYQVSEYFHEFELDEHKELKGKHTAKQVNKIDLSQLALLQYTRLYRFQIDKSIYKKLNCHHTVEPE